MKIQAITYSWNDKSLLEYCINHYKRQNIPIHVFDNMSTDGTTDMLKSINVPFTSYDTNETFDYLKFRRLATEKLHEEKPDWFLIVSPDEFIITEHEQGLHGIIRDVNDVGFNRITTPNFVFYYTGNEIDNGYDPRLTYFFYEEFQGHDHERISKYDETIDLVKMGEPEIPGVHRNPIRNYKTILLHYQVRKDAPQKYRLWARRTLKAKVEHKIKPGDNHHYMNRIENNDWIKNQCDLSDIRNHNLWDKLMRMTSSFNGDT